MQDTLTVFAVEEMFICPKLEAKSFGDGSQDICKYKESNLGPDAGSNREEHFFNLYILFRDFCRLWRKKYLEKAIFLMIQTNINLYMFQVESLSDESKNCREMS